ncbi:MAG TPA: ribonuclease H-like domain-containing protein [Saprospiraceae bacterium]|nr:ribonuclease H-like domain-containing protein [Saprospiraceae bacterium]HMQ83532.1 ribonuclease H-like domain-containing protein [Saprospiraceae bacterium]
MIDKVDIANVLFLDIETVCAKSQYQELDDTMQELWQLKAKQILRVDMEDLNEEASAKAYKDKAAIFAEFGKIVCISVGAIHRDKEDQKLKVRLKSFASENEAELLHAFSQLLFQHYNDPNKFFLCGHNIKEFDVPYICRRMVVNQLPMPNMLNISGKKPWEIAYLIDTLELWKFGDHKHFTSLKLLAAVLGFPSPKDDMDGSQVGHVYWEEKDLKRIAHYCEKDVLATIQLFLRFKRMPLLESDQISHIGIN